MRSKPSTHRDGRHEPAMQPLGQRVAAERRAHPSRFWLERLLAVLAGALLLVLLLWAPAGHAALAAQLAPPGAALLRIAAAAGGAADAATHEPGQDKAWQKGLWRHTPSTAKVK